jgi:hypothetical protein
MHRLSLAFYDRDGEIILKCDKMHGGKLCGEEWRIAYRETPFPLVTHHVRDALQHVCRVRMELESGE